MFDLFQSITIITLVMLKVFHFSANGKTLLTFFFFFLTRPQAFDVGSENEMVAWHRLMHMSLKRLMGDSEQTLGDSEQQESLACYNPWSHKESDTIIERVNDNK